MAAVITLFRTFRTVGIRLFLQARAKCFALQRIRVHYSSSQVLLTAAFVLWPSDAVCGLLAYLCAGLRFSDPPPLHPPPPLYANNCKSLDIKWDSSRGRSNQKFQLFANLRKFRWQNSKISKIRKTSMPAIEFFNF